MPPSSVWAAKIDVAQEASKCEMCEIDRLIWFAVVAFKPVKAGVDFVPVIIDPHGPANRLGPKPRLVSDQDDRLAHALCKSMVSQHPPSTRCLSRDQNTTARQRVKILADYRGIEDGLAGVCDERRNAS